MKGRLDSKIAIVTGAARGIGRSITERFLKEGANVVLADIENDILKKTVNEIDPIGKQTTHIKIDVSSPSDTEEIAKLTLDRFNKIDILINNAGIAPNRLIVEQSLEEWNEVIKVNLTGCFLCSKAVVKPMTENGGGHIINISSISGQRGATGRSAYGVSKAGIIQLTREMAVEFADMKILVNSIAPGPILTDLTNNSPNASNSYLERIPLRKFGTKDSVAAAAVYLASDECDFTTGHTLNIDGGFNDAGLIFPKEDLMEK